MLLCNPIFDIDGLVVGTSEQGLRGDIGDCNVEEIQTQGAYFWA